MPNINHWFNKEDACLDKGVEKCGMMYKQLEEWHTNYIKNFIRSAMPKGLFIAFWCVDF
jgi:hypothetical protein